MSRHLSFAVKLVLTVGIFALVLAGVDLGRIGPALASLDLAVIPWVFGLAALQTVILALRWRIIANFVGAALPLGSAVQGTLVSFFFSQGLPASVGGDVFRVWWLRRETGAGTAEASHAVLIDRLAGFLSLLLLSAASVVLLARNVAGPGTRAMEAILAVGIAAAVALTVPTLPPVKRLWFRLLDRVPARPRAFLVWLGELKSLIGRMLRQVRLSAAGLGIGVVVHLVTVLIAYLVVRALGYDLAFWQCLAVVPPALLLTYLPISIAGWGTREATMMFGFGLFGLPATGGFLVSIVIGLVVLGVALFGGAVWLGAEWRVALQRPDREAAER